MVTLYDVARRAIVSTATVSRVVRGQDRVREVTRIRVQRAIDELGYVPDGAGQSLSRRRKDIIGMMCVERETAGQHDLETECLLYYDEEAAARRPGADPRQPCGCCSAPSCGQTGPANPELSRLDPLSGKVDGILIFEGFPAPSTSSASPPTPDVVVIAGTPRAQAADVVAADNFSGAAAMITHLIADRRAAPNPRRRPAELPRPRSGGGSTLDRRAARRPAMPAHRRRAGDLQPLQRRAGRGRATRRAPRSGWPTPWGGMRQLTRWPSACCGPSPQPASTSPTR